MYIVYSNRVSSFFLIIDKFRLHYCISCEFESRSWRGVLNTTLCVKVCQRLAAGRWFSPDTQISSTNRTDRHDITELLLKAKHHNSNTNES